MTRQPPASGLVLCKYDDKAYRVHDRTSDADLGYVFARYDDWIVYSPERLPLAVGWTRDRALHAAWPDLWPTRPAQPPVSPGGQSGEGDVPNAPQTTHRQERHEFASVPAVQRRDGLSSL